MDRRIRYFIGLDSETCNGLPKQGGGVDLSQSLVYDLGWAVTDKRGKIYITRSYVVYETFVGMSDVMRSAYYAKKIPQYWKDIKEGKRTLATLATIRKQLLDDMKNYNANTVFAHNAKFDHDALDNTIRYCTKSKSRYFLPYGTIWYDTMKMAKSTICKQKTYEKFCHANGYLTAHKVPQVRATAEVLYRYISKNTEFVESHTGLEDVLIETQIFAKCYAQHKKMVKHLFKNQAVCA
jgi:hypothetical protein